MSNRSPIRRAAASLAASALLAMLAVPAFAAQGPAESVEIRLINDSQGAIVLASSTVPKGQKLPAKVTLAVPTGTEILWAGEILGGDPSKDPEAKYDRTPGDGWDTIVMTVSQSRTGQIEYRDPSAVSASGQQKSARIAYVSPVAASSGALSIEVPQGAQVADSGGAQPDQSSGGFYRKSIKSVKAGDELSLAITYAEAAGQPAQGGQPGAPPSGQGGVPASAQGGAPASPTTVIIVGLLLVAGTLFGLRFVNSRQGR